MDNIKLLNEIKQGKLAPVYLFWGAEDYLLEKTIKQIIKSAVPPESADFNVDIFYGNEVDGKKVMQTASSYPFMGEQRVVIVKNLHRMKPGCVEVINHYVRKPSPTTCLILTAPKVNFRFKHFKMLKKESVALEFKGLYDRQIPGWIRQYLKEMQLEITEEACRILHGNVGNSLRALVNELDKIILGLNECKRIEADDIRNVVGLSRGFSVFELTNQIGNKKLKASFGTISRMLELGESPIGILTMLGRHFSILLKIKHGTKAGKSQSQLISIAGIPPYFIKDYVAQAKNFSLKQLQRAFSLLLNADVELKSSYQKPHIVLELLAYNLIKN